MIRIEIHEDACRGCKLCVDVCPTEVFSFDETACKARVKEAQDCIGCLSCAFVCPAAALRHEGIHAVKNFYRDVEASRRMEKYL